MQDVGWLTGWRPPKMKTTRSVSLWACGWSSSTAGFCWALIRAEENDTLEPLRSSLLLVRSARSSRWVVEDWPMSEQTWSDCKVLQRQPTGRTHTTKIRYLEENTSVVIVTSSQMTSSQYDTATDDLQKSQLSCFFLYSFSCLNWNCFEMTHSKQPR